MEDVFQKVADLFKTLLQQYHTISCSCAHPRYRQIVGIDCANAGDSYSCHETEMLIDMSKPYFSIQPGPPGNEGNHHTWTCKKCNSADNVEWQDFSIHVSRRTMQVIELKVTLTGRAAIKPILLVLGLSGHSFPPRTEMMPVEYDVFEKYILETDIL